MGTGSEGSSTSFVWYQIIRLLVSATDPRVLWKVGVISEVRSRWRVATVLTSSKVEALNLRISFRILLCESMDCCE
jgi:hypothetical protein